MAWRYQRFWIKTVRSFQLFAGAIEGLDQLVALELRKVLVDLMVKLIMYQAYKPVLRFMNRCLVERLVDMSIVRYFILEVSTFIWNLLYIF